MAIVGLRELGTVSYAGYVFLGAYHISCESEQVLDDAGRSHVYTRHIFDIDSIVADGLTNADGDMLLLRAYLSRPGGRFILDNVGFGESIDTGAFPDVNFGPKPQIIAWRPVGGNKAMYVRWRIEVCQAHCRATGILALNYDVRYSIDARGNTTRTISGYLQIANNASSGIPTDDPDAYRSFVAPAVPKGFKRMQEYHTDAARLRLQFTIRDQEIASNNPYPPLVCEAEGEHNVRWSRGVSGAKLFNSMSFRMVIQADTSPAASYFAGLLFAFNSIAYSISQNKTAILDDVEVTEDLFGRMTSCNFSWTVYSDFTHFVQDSGLWKPLGTDWTVWHAAMNQLAHHPYGNAGLHHIPADDVIVDTCADRGTPIPNNYSTVHAPALPTIMQTYMNQTPPPERSYLDYQMSGVVHYDRQTISQQTLQAPDQPTGTDNLLEETPATFGGQSSSVNNIIQQSSIGNYRIIITGKARRMGYEVPKPLLRTVGGATATEVGGYFYPLAERNAAGVPIFTAMWMLVYVISGSPGAFHPGGNPMEGLYVNQANPAIIETAQVQAAHS